MHDDQHRRPMDTREFLGMWHAVTDQHFAEQMNALLPGLLRGVNLAEPATMSVLAGRILHALRLAAGPDADLTAALRYLKDAAEQPGQESG
jgi:hypothetical protein